MSGRLDFGAVVVRGAGLLGELWMRVVRNSPRSPAAAGAQHHRPRRASGAAAGRRPVGAARGPSGSLPAGATGGDWGAWSRLVSVPRLAYAARTGRGLRETLAHPPEDGPALLRRGAAAFPEKAAWLGGLTNAVAGSRRA